MNTQTLQQLTTNPTNNTQERFNRKYKDLIPWRLKKDNGKQLKEEMTTGKKGFVLKMCFCHSFIIHVSLFAMDFTRKPDNWGPFGCHEIMNNLFHCGNPTNSNASTYNADLHLLDTTLLKWVLSILNWPKKKK